MVALSSTNATKNVRSLALTDAGVLNNFNNIKVASACTTEYVLPTSDIKKQLYWVVVASNIFRLKSEMTLCVFIYIFFCFAQVESSTKSNAVVKCRLGLAFANCIG